MAPALAVRRRPDQAGAGVSVGSFVLDAWAALSFKRDTAWKLRSSERALAPMSWVGQDDRRRIEAYLLLSAYFQNVARLFAPAETTDEERRSTREYGDAALLVKTARTAVLGEDQSIVVDGASDDPGEEPELPEGADDDRRAEFEAEHAEWVTRRAEVDAAAEREEWLRDWASSQVERLTSKMMEVETDAQKLGDGVYVLGWSPSKRRVRLRIYDPASYFPVLDPSAAEDEFPRRVHIAWEFEQGLGTERRRFVRRLTWELAPIRPLEDDRGDLLEGDGGGLVFADDVRADEFGRPFRMLPYSDEPVYETCYHSDGTWEVTDADLDSLTEKAARWAIDDAGRLVRGVDLGIDFLPVVHLPNTVAIKDHFGEALITSLSQILDDLSAADTDSAKSADLVGVPMIGVSGVVVDDEVTVRPGALLRMGSEGKLSVVDISGGLVALGKHVDRLLDRLSTNARLPDAVLGRIDPADISSGFHMALTFGPMRSLVAEQRLVRDEKYPLLLKFQQRWSLVAGAAARRENRKLGPWELDPDSGVLDARIEFGSFLPNDGKSLVDLVVALFGAKLLSRKGALRLLVAGGVLDVDLADAMLEAQHEDFAAALQLLEATGDEAAVFEYLGLDPPVDEPAVEPDLSGDGGVPPFPGSTAPPGPPAAGSGGA